MIGALGAAASRRRFRVLGVVILLTVSFVLALGLSCPENIPLYRDQHTVSAHDDRASPCGRRSCHSWERGNGDRAPHDSVDVAYIELVRGFVLYFHGVKQTVSALLE